MGQYLNGELADLLERVSIAPSFEEAAGALTLWARNLTGCESVLLRLQEANRGVSSKRWIPVFSGSGLGSRFLQEEALIGADECLCGRVSQGRVDPHLPFFTAGGSFLWDHAQSLAEDFDLAALGNIRGRCLRDGFDSLGIFPLGGDSGPVGCLHLADHAPDRFSPYLEILEAACAECGPLLLRHRDEGREGALLRTIEAALLPLDLPQVPGLDLAVSFTSATSVARVGGDFYDVLDLGDGGILLYVGDYTGKGIGVAGLAARVRLVVSELALLYPDPAEILTQADARLRGLLSAEQSVTLAACHLSGIGTLRAAVAGHPRPLLLKGNGSSLEVSLPSNVPLGLGAGAPFVGRSVPFYSDDVLLLYTDGVTESRCGDHFFGEAGIRRAWRNNQADSLQAFARTVCERSARFHDDRLPADDRLVLTAQLRG